MEPAPATPHLCALVADDDPVVRMLVATALRTVGIEVEEVGDGAAAVASASRQMPDLVVLDVQMPKKNGFDAKRRIGSFR